MAEPGITEAVVSYKVPKGAYRSRSMCHALPRSTVAGVWAQAASTPGREMLKCALLFHVWGQLVKYAHTAVERGDGGKVPLCPRRARRRVAPSW
jgi:hypothetical protein